MDAYAWKKAAAGVFFPRRRCVSCGCLSVDSALCPRCRAQMLGLSRCARCASFVAATETAAYRCRDCCGGEPAFTLARAALPYEGMLREQLLAFKYGQRPGLRRPLAETLLLAYDACYAQVAFDTVLPTPLSAARLAGRGYNQAQLLSELVAAELKLPHRPAWLTRTRDTRPLAELERGERERELGGAFQTALPLHGERILLIDDIFTTGVTLEMCSRALRKAGAGAVYGLAVAAGRDL